MCNVDLSLHVSPWSVCLAQIYILTVLLFPRRLRNTYFSVTSVAVRWIALGFVQHVCVGCLFLFAVFVPVVCCGLLFLFLFMGLWVEQEFGLSAASGMGLFMHPCLGVGLWTSLVAFFWINNVVRWPRRLYHILKAANFLVLKYSSSIFLSLLLILNLLRFK